MLRPIPYPSSSSAVKIKYKCLVSSPMPAPTRGTLTNVVCKVCKKLIERDYPIESFNSVISVAEQEHLLSEEHQELEMFNKLGGSDG